MCEAGFGQTDVLAIEGPGWLLQDFDAQWADPRLVVVPCLGKLSAHRGSVDEPFAWNHVVHKSRGSDPTVERRSTGAEAAPAGVLTTGFGDHRSAGLRKDGSARLAGEGREFDEYGAEVLLVGSSHLVSLVRSSTRSQPPGNSRTGQPGSGRQSSQPVGSSASMRRINASPWARTAAASLDPITSSRMASSNWSSSFQNQVRSGRTTTSSNWSHKSKPMRERRSGVWRFRYQPRN